MVIRLTTVVFAFVTGVGAFAAGCAGGGASARLQDSGADRSSVDAPTDSSHDSPEPDVVRTEDASDGALGPDADAGVACGLLPEGGTAPQDAGDVTYSWTGAQTACFGESFCQAPCATTFLQGLLDCDRVEGGYFWNFGSVYIRVAGRRGGSCVYDIGSEVEGSVTYKECTAPMPVAPWPGLRFRNDNGGPNVFNGLEGCTPIAACSVQPGLGTPCNAGPEAVPTCPPYPSHC
jgi:hypothetical protein